MTALDWLAESSIYIGRPGALVELPVTLESKISDDTDAGWSFDTTVSGRVHAQRRIRARRSWDVSLEYLPAHYVDALRTLYFSSTEAYYALRFITPYAQVANVLTPDDTAFTDIVENGTVSVAQAFMLPDKSGFAPAALVSTNNDSRWTVATTVAPPARVPVSVSIWMRGLNPLARIDWFTAEGVALTQTQVNTKVTPASAGEWNRYVAKGAEVPAGAAYGTIAVAGVQSVAAAQVTWTKEPPVMFESGQGCTSAVISEAPFTYAEINQDGAWASAKFSVMEVG